MKKLVKMGLRETLILEKTYTIPRGIDDICNGTELYILLGFKLWEWKF